jgi:hypothetical protein
MPKKHDLIGQRFGRLVVVQDLGRKSSANGKRWYYHWSCCCDCGSSTIASGDNLRAGHVQSCGCHRREQAAHDRTTHGMFGTSEYGIWSGMLTRCYNPNAHDYCNYGGRGIGVHPEWRNSFESYYAYTGPRPPGLTLDRINNNGNYEPGNVRWATRKEQAANKRPARRKIIRDVN